MATSGCDRSTCNISHHRLLLIKDRESIFNTAIDNRDATANPTRPGGVAYFFNFIKFNVNETKFGESGVIGFI